MEHTLDLRGGDGTVSIVSVRPAEGQAAVLIEAVRKRWPDLDGLIGAALHSGLGGELVELLSWRGDASPAAMAVYENDLSPLGSIAGKGITTPGPGLSGDGLVLKIDPETPRPTLISRMACASANQARIMEYLIDSAERFRGLFGGWLGAVIYPSLDGCSVVEYLQFESLEAMVRIKDLPVLEEHKANLMSLGSIDSVVAVAGAVWSRNLTEA